MTCMIYFLKSTSTNSSFLAKTRPLDYKKDTIMRVSSGGSTYEMGRGSSGPQTTVDNQKLDFR